MKEVEGWPQLSLPMDRCVCHEYAQQSTDQECEQLEPEH